MVGNVSRHESEASIIESKTSYRFQVVKVNTSGFKQKRVLLVDPETSAMWNFNRKMNLKKKVPVSQLVQVCHFTHPVLHSASPFVDRPCT